METSRPAKMAQRKNSCQVKHSSLHPLTIVHRVGSKVVMNLKFLLQPTIEKIREDGRAEGLVEGREEGREMGRAEEREENSKAVKSWLEEQIRAGRISEDVELPVFGDSGNGNRPPRENGNGEG